MTINNRERTMQVTLHSGQSYDVLFASRLC